MADDVIKIIPLVERQPHVVLICDEGHAHVLPLVLLRQYAAGLLDPDALPVCVLRSIVADWTHQWG